MPLTSIDTPAASTLLHFVMCKFGDEVLTCESDPMISFETVCADVWSGQFEDLVRVVSFDTATSQGADVTKKVAEALSDRSHRDEDTPHYEVAELIRSHGFTTFVAPMSRREWMEDHADYLRDARIDREMREAA